MIYLSKPIGCDALLTRVKNAAKKAAIGLLRLYKQHISPGLPPSCRFVPTCSQYAIDAIEKYGLLKGLFKAVWRVLRCNPYCKGGYDPA